MIVLSTFNRNVLNSNFNKRLRKMGFITGNIYNKYINIPIQILLCTKNILLIKYFLNKRLLLNLENIKKPVVLKEISIHPVNEKIINLDFFLI